MIPGFRPPLYGEDMHDALIAVAGDTGGGRPR